MLKTYHGLFEFNKEERRLLSSFSYLYNHVYHHAYALWAKQQAIVFSTQRNLTQQQLIHLFYHNHISDKINTKNNSNNKSNVKSLSLQSIQNLPKFNFTLSSEHKKQILANKLISSRQLNSIHFELQGNLKSLYELKKLDLKNKITKLNSLNQDITLLKQKVKSQLVLLNYDSTHKNLLNNIYKQYILFKSHKFNNIKYNRNIKKINKNNKYRKKDKFIFDDNISENLIKTKYKLYTLIIKRHNLQHKTNKIITQLMTGKLPICFGSNTLFHKQYNLKHYKNNNKHNSYNPHKLKKTGKINPKYNHDKYMELWKEEFTATRNHSFYLMGTAAETSGNQSCQAIIQHNNNDINEKDLINCSNSRKNLITLKIRLPDGVLLENNPNHNIHKRTDDNYIFLKDIDFGIYHDKLIKVLKDNESEYYIDKKNKVVNPLRKPIHYRFTKNINSFINKQGKVIKSPKYGKWTISFSIEEKAKSIITNRNCGGIGIDLNQEHISVSEISHDGNLLKSYDIPLKLSYFQETYPANHDMRNKDTITTLNSNQSAWLIEQVVNKLCQQAKETAKPIIVEDLDFEYKKNSLFNDSQSNNKYRKKKNRQLSMFVYSKFKSSLLSRAEKERIEVIQVNPAYTSLLGLVKYQKRKGISSHQAASYVIARKGLNYKEKIYTNNIDNNKELKSKKEVKKYELIYRGKVIEILAPVRKPNISCINYYSLLKVLSKDVKALKLKQDKVLSLHKKELIQSLEGNSLSLQPVKTQNSIL